MNTNDTAAALDTLVDRGIIKSFGKTTTNKKLVWDITVTDEAAVDMTTAETGAFIAGANLVSASRKTGPREGSRAYVMRHDLDVAGEVRITMPSDDPKAVRVERTSMFNAAYSLGLKGRFSVKTDKNTDSGTVTLVGTVTDDE